MKHKTSELIGALLDAAVAKAEGKKPYKSPIDKRLILGYSVDAEIEIPRYSTEWSQGGPIIEREGIGIERVKPDSMDAGNPLVSDGRWMWVTDTSCGPTPLIAAMRAYVASKLGSEVEL